ncbi:nuclear transport factor 2 family protein [Marinobacterium sp. AK62]|uniref:Nuclear transport factor 2 family protein n=1 Tax=Marinobacterium alkalitolerans TaxID=1542925 RepID=A0ABS3ZB15_9GAMM|nr:nuclear transport factor 2 family protein [Marinobacterium alkalitolerans]MBP0048891.1 nuclear transport factor 2 family protein [Marinobacterium alkalitolerans]
MSEAALERYATTFANLTPDTVDELCALVSEGVYFKDPFNDIQGRQAFKHLLLDMFERAGRPAFSVDTICWHQASETGWLRWHFRADLPVIGRLEVEGCSRVLFDAHGQVSTHMDYWDSAPVYLKLPLIGRLLRGVRHRISSQAS